MSTRWSVRRKFALGLTAASALLALRSPAQAQWSIFETGELKESEILAASSTGALPVQSARVIVDNDAAFQTKLEAIRSARSSIRMVYYIYSDDHSSSVLSEELIAAAKRGVQVRLLLDYHTNHKHLDLLAAMMKEGNSGRGRLEVRLFNGPTLEIKKDSKFLVSACSAQAARQGGTACSDEKLAAVERFFAQDPSGQSSFFLKLFLAGLYSKNVAALQLAAVEGSGFNAAATASAQPSKEEIEQLMEFGRLVFDAKFRGSLQAKIKLGLAFAMYGEKLGPIYNMLTSTLPVERERNEAAKMDWKHLTDFTHHKLLAVDDTFIQLGGRNIEDSYHMQANELTKKYIFMDTDMLVRLKSAHSGVAGTYDRLFNFRAMSVPLADVQREAPLGLLKNLPLVQQAVASCATTKASQPARYENCVATAYSRSSVIADEARQDEALRLMRQNAQIYRTRYQPRIQETWRAALNQGDELSAQDVRSMLLTYIENVPFDKSVAVGQERRKYGVDNGRDERSGKYIHSLWTQSLRHLCRETSRSGQRQRVILHQGYVLMPSNLMIAMGSMLNGDWDCRNVEVLILTNSPQTTDLNIINFFARHQLKALLDYAANSPVQSKARIRVLEHKAPTDGSKVRSLHTKLNIIGNDVILGSANADVRSYYMDTNNGFFFRGAREFVRDYQAHVARLIADRNQVGDLSQELLRKSTADLINEDLLAIRALVQKYDKQGRITPERLELINQQVVRVLTYTFQTNQKLVNRLMIDVQVPHGEGGSHGQEDGERLRLQNDLANDFNSLMMLL